MTTDNGTFKAGKRDAKAIKREELIKMMSNIGNKMYIRLSAARFKERATDDTYLKYVRAWSGVMQGLNTALHDEDLNTINERLQKLEEQDTNTEGRVKVYE